MSFGFSISDVLKIAEYSVLVYRQCRDCTGQYRSLASETRQLSSTLEDLADLVKKKRLDKSKQDELLERAVGCQEVLGDLEKVLKKYSSLSTQSKRTWDRLGWDQQGGRELRDRLTSNVTMLNNLYQVITLSSQFKLQDALDQLLTDYQGGHRDASSVSSLTVESFGDDHNERNEDAAWSQIIRDLEDLGIDEHLASKHRPLIIEWFIDAINEGKLQEQPPEEDVSGKEIWVTFDPSVSRPQQENSPIQHTSCEMDTPSTAAASPSYTHNFEPAPSLPTVRRGGATPPHGDKNLLWTAQLITDHWNRREWRQAAEHLSVQIKAVEAGVSIDINDASWQPDIRVLTHLLGVARTFMGDYVQAKSLFESVIRGPYEDGWKLDHGDLIAAQWLGDTCVLLNQSVNAALAYAIALEGFSHRNFASRANRIRSEIHVLDTLVSGLSTLEHSLRKNNIDPSTILPATATADKFRLVAWTSEQLRGPYEYVGQIMRGSKDLSLVEGFLIQPLIDQSSWPMEFDPFFLIRGAIRCRNLMGVTCAPFPDNIDKSAFPTTTLGQSNKLAYVTTRDPNWLIGTLRQALRLHDIEYQEKPHASSITCRMSWAHNNIHYKEGVEIKLRKLPLRSVHGFKVTSTKVRTRDPCLPARIDVQNPTGLVSHLVEILRDFCRNAESAT